jgi:catechol 2,3-dioxygenase-like lactoylglutathione lyase family enzyme
MLSTTRMTTVLPVKDLDRAKKFYHDALGLTALDGGDASTALYASDGGNSIELLVRPDVDTSDHTSLSFEVQDLGTEMHGLEERGIHFNDYDLPGLKTENHIATSEHQKCAWFPDSEGNILCLHQNI